MKFKRIVSMLCLSIAALAILLACDVGASIPFISQAQPTETKRATREPRPTFTPRPKVTDTEVPAPTDEPTDVPPTVAPTDIPPTAKPVVRVTAKPKPTTPPQPVSTPVPQATKNPYQFGFFPATCSAGADPAACNIQNNVKCQHSGGTHLYAVVYNNYKDPGSTVAGRRVVFSYAADGPAFGDQVEETGYDGKADKTMSPDGSFWTGTAYAWVVDANNKRISEIGGPVKLNNHNENTSDPCQIATFLFAGGR